MDAASRAAERIQVERFHVSDAHDIWVGIIMIFRRPLLDRKIERHDCFSSSKFEKERATLLLDVSSIDDNTLEGG